MSTAAYVTEIPNCDFCQAEAHVDGKTLMGPWAYMCKEHYRQYGVGLGMGRGQVLVLRKGTDSK